MEPLFFGGGASARKLYHHHVPNPPTTHTHTHTHTIRGMSALPSISSSRTVNYPQKRRKCIEGMQTIQIASTTLQVLRSENTCARAITILVV